MVSFSATRKFKKPQMISKDPFQSLYREILHEGRKEKFPPGKKGEGPGYFLFRDLRLSRIAFGGYRIGLEDPEHKDALILALKSGVNVIDVSANYGDGEAESLVGKVLDENFKKGNSTERNFYSHESRIYPRPEYEIGRVQRKGEGSISGNYLLPIRLLPLYLPWIFRRPVGKI